MKIISKIKDFYDWVVGIYGIDEKMVYDRRSEDQFILAKYLKEKTYWSTKIRNKDGGYWWISCWILMGSKLWEFEFRPVHNPNSDLDPKLPKFKYEWKTPTELIYEWENERRHIWEKEQRPCNGDIINREKLLRGSKVYESNFSFHEITKEELKTPVILNIDTGSFNPLILNPILKNTPLESFIPAEDAFLSIQDFIGSLKDMNPEDKRNDIQKLESAGFDKKTSFRKM